MVDFRLQLDWKPNAQFAGILIAHYYGWYQQTGIELDIIPWRPYLNQVEVLKTDENMIISTEDNLLIQGRVAGQSIKAIATMMQYSGIGWMSLKSSNINAIADLKGKRIGIHGDGETAIKITLQQCNLSAKDVDIVEVGYDYPQLLETGEFDAIQCLVAIEPNELKTEGFDLNVLPAYEWGYEVYSQVICTSDRLIQEYPEALSAFLKVTFDGWRYAFNHVSEVADVVVSHYLHESNSTMQATLIHALKPLFEGQIGMQKLGWMTPERWLKSMSYLQQQALDTDNLSPESVMTTTLLDFDS
ncbi:MAG: ABC transporter substrate-binding protein [Cyanobacteria bacterium P01_F01_bin.86]